MGALATTDARGFLARYPDGAVIDEAQRAPDLFSDLHTRVDGDRRTGLFVLTGSQQFGLMERISQSLARRVGLLHLLPFAFDEVAATRPADDLEDWLWRGFYPPLHDRAIPPVSHRQTEISSAITFTASSIALHFATCAARTATPARALTQETMRHASALVSVSHSESSPHMTQCV